jgi:hypothetical protein
MPADSVPAHQLIDAILKHNGRMDGAGFTRIGRRN